MLKSKLLSASVDDFNKALVNNNIHLNLVDYFSKLHKQFFATVDISFMNYFIEISDPKKMDEFYIQEKELRRYGIIDDTIRVKDIIHKYNLIRDQDWIFYTDSNDDVVKRTSLLNLFFNGESLNIQRVFLFTPRSFKKMIIYSGRPEYIEYYLLLECIYRHYYDYQVMVSKKIDECSRKNNNKINRHITSIQNSISKVLPIIEILEECSVDLRSICNTSMGSLDDMLEKK